MCYDDQPVTERLFEKRLSPLQTDPMGVTPSTYQLAGLDDLGRGFTRQVNMTIIQETFQAVFRYETFLCETEPHVTEHAALASLISRLQERGYTQLRSRLQFRDATYLGSQECWEEHPGVATTGLVTGIVHALRTIFRSRRVS